MLLNDFASNPSSTYITDKLLGVRGIIVRIFLKSGNSLPFVASST